MVTLISQPAAAQAQRPYRGLFGGGAPPGDGHSLSASGSVGVGYDDNVLADQTGLGGGSGGGPQRAVAGYLGVMNGSLSYTGNLPRVAVGASFGSSLRYFPDQTQDFVSGYSAGFGMSTALGRRTTLGFSQSALYMPYTLATVLPPAFEPGLGQVDAPPVDLVTGQTEYLSYGTNASLSHRFSMRWTGFAGYSYNGRDSSLYNTPFAQHSIGGGMNYQLGAGLSLNLGYRRLRADFDGLDGGAAQDTIDAGVNYNRTLSFSRATRVSFGTGSSAIKTEAGITYRTYLTGNFLVTHQFGRTWTAFAGYNRSLRFVDTLLEPIAGDSLSGGVSGLLSRRVQFNAMVRGSVGRVGNVGRDNSYDSTLSTAGIGIAVARQVNFGLSYSYYHYKFDDDVILPIGVPAGVDRQSVRATLTVWAPVF